MEYQNVTQPRKKRKMQSSWTQASKQTRVGTSFWYKLKIEPVIHHLRDHTRILGSVSTDEYAYPCIFYIYTWDWEGISELQETKPVELRPTMGLQTQPLHILIFPFMAPGHMSPMIDIAKLFNRQGVKVTILTTPANADIIQPTIQSANKYSNDRRHHPITIFLVPFPSTDAGLPEGCENLSSIPSQDLNVNFITAISMLRQPFSQVLKELSPDCVVTDMFFPWTYDVAAEHGIPRLVFHGTSFFALCAQDTLLRHKPLDSLPPDAQSFVLQGLPHRIEMLRDQIPDLWTSDPPLALLISQAIESDRQSYGVVVNSFKELEPDYVEYYRKEVRRRAWHIGPVSLCNENEVEMSSRGNKASIDSDTCLKWLDSKMPGSVVYVCFGSLSEFTAVQLREIALGLEASNHPFILVVRSCNHRYEERNEGKGLIIRGWAPQVLILNHRSVGGFVTHCGWNSCLEGVTAGVPLATWPLFAEQFYNERLVVDVLGIGVCMGVKKYCRWPEERTVLEAAEIEKAVNNLMGSGEMAESRRRAARILGEQARRAIQKGGSSYTDMGNLIKELKCKPVATESGTSF